jgi:hypothetical protein
MPRITPGSAFAADYKPQIDWSDVIKQATQAKTMSEVATDAVEDGRIKALAHLSEKSKATERKIARRVKK